MQCSALRNADTNRLVGDPVDVVTGALIDLAGDFKLPWPLPVQWQRHYSSARHDQPLPLGFGQTHSYDHRLQLDVDGIRYTPPDGGWVGFPFLLEDGAQADAGPFTLRRLDLRTYHLYRAQDPVLEFTFGDLSRPAFPRRIRRGRHTLQLKHRPEGWLEAIVEEQTGRSVRVENDPAGRITGLTLLVREAGLSERQRVLMTYRYDREGRLVEAIDPYRNGCRFEYDHANRMIRRTDRRGYAFEYGYDEQGRCILARGEDGVQGVRLRYLALERVTGVTRADGGEWLYFYDEAGTVTKIIDPYGGVRKFELDEEGRVKAEIDPNGDVTEVVYDRRGERMGRRTSTGQFRRPGEEAGSNSPSHRVARNPLEWEFGDLMPPGWIRPGQEADPLLERMAVAAGGPDGTVPEARPPRPGIRPLLLNGASSRSTLFDSRFPDDTGERVYDELGHLIEERLGSGSTRRWMYDANGNIRRYIDAQGSSYIFDYASWNHRIRATDPLGNVLTYTYTSSERIASVTDPGGTRSDYLYDLKDRLVEVRRNGAVRESYRYDLADNLIEKRGGDGQPLVTYQIGSHNLVSECLLATGERQTFEYDEAGRFVRMTEGDLDHTFAYDGYGRRVADLRNGRGARSRFVGGCLLEATVLERFTTRYRHHGGGLLEMIDPSGSRHLIQLETSGRITRQVANGSSEISFFDSWGRCLGRQLFSGHADQPPWKRFYRYSREGMLVQVTDSEWGETTYHYDAAHRLTEARGPDQIANFRYDPAGNLLEQPGLQNVSMAAGNQVISANGAHFGYDSRHRVTHRIAASHSIRYVYDSLDRLRRIHGLEVRWECGYDPLDRLIWRDIDGRRTEYI